MSEKAPLVHSKERHVPSGEHRAHQERLRQHHESQAEKAARSSGETTTLSHEAHEQAISSAEYQSAHLEQTSHSRPLTKEDKLHSFNTVMHHVRSELPAHERTFSKIIHSPAVEKSSEIIGRTIARPSGIAGATAAAVVGLLSIYSIARFSGFELSGSEMPLLLVIGFVIGLFAEWSYKAVRSIFAPKSQ